MGADVDAGADAEADADAEAEAEESDEDAIATRLSQRGDRFTATGHTVLGAISPVQPCRLEDRSTARRQNNGAQGRCVSIALSRFLGSVATGESPGRRLGPGEPCMALGPSEFSVSYGGTSLAFRETGLNRHLFFATKSLLHGHWHGAQPQSGPPGYAKSQRGSPSGAFARDMSQDMVWEEPYGQWGCNSHGGVLAAALAVRSGNKSQGARVVCCPHGGGWCLPPY